jgi:hypothetical protein
MMESPPVAVLDERLKIRRRPADSPWLGRRSWPDRLCRASPGRLLAEAFRPGPEQLRGARAWLVHVIARRAVEMLKAEDEGE